MPVKDVFRTHLDAQVGTEVDLKPDEELFTLRLTMKRTSVVELEADGRLRRQLVDELADAMIERVQAIRQRPRRAAMPPQQGGQK